MDSSDDDVFGLGGGYASRRAPIHRTASLQTSFPPTKSPKDHHAPVKCLSSPISSRRLVRQSRLCSDPHSGPHVSPPQRSQSSSSRRGKGCPSAETPASEDTSLSRSSSSSPQPGPRHYSSSSHRGRTSAIPVSPLASPSPSEKSYSKEFSDSSPRPAPTFLRFGKMNVDSLFAAPSRSESLQELFSESPATSKRNIFTDVFNWGKTRMIETDSKSLNSLSTQSAGSGHGTGHSRKSSDTSQISVQSGGSGGSSGGGSSGGGGGVSQDPEEDLWGMWGRLVNDWENWNKKKSPQVKDLVRKGIPVHFRGITWQLLCDAHSSPDKFKYAEHLKTTSACEKVIRRDIARTYPEHDFFKEKDGLGQESLFNVMKAYSLHDREVGYCQGSAFIVGLLLMQMPEEEAFAVLVKLMQDYRLREMFKPSMAELGLCMYQLETLIQEHLPDLHAHFTSQSFHTSMYASSWFLTLFATSLPLGGACRVMDCFLVDGLEVIFRIALAVLTISKEELFAMDMEGMLKYFQRDLPVKFEADPETYFTMAYSIRYNAKKMKKMEKEYTAMKTKEQEELVELKRLRTENRLLRQKIDCLEAESSALADRLIQGQVSRAEEAEHNFAIKRELAALRQHDGETLEQLNYARDKIRKLTGMIEENSSSRESSLAELIIKEEELAQKEELVKCLQEELVQVRLKTAEAEATTRDFQGRVSELECEQRRQREATPDLSVAHLQEELIAVRLREAEANLALKDLRHRLQELTQLWTRHLHDQHSDKSDKNADSSSSGSSGAKKLGGLLGAFERGGSDLSARLEEELMTTKLHETSAVAELKEARLRVMELETAVQVSSNQVGRQEEENKRLQESLESSQAEVRRLQSALGEQRRKFGDLESQMKEDKMMARIREAEKSQNLAELTQKISSLEYKNQELVTEGEVGRVSRDSEQVPPLQDKLEDLQSELARLRAVNRQLSVSRGIQRLDYGSEIDSDMEDPEDLRLTLSPSVLSGDMVTLNGDLDGCDVTSTDPTSSSPSLLKSSPMSSTRLANGDVTPPINSSDAALPNGNLKSPIFPSNPNRSGDTDVLLNNNTNTHNNNTSINNESNNISRVRNYSSGSSVDHNHIREELSGSSPLRKRSSSSECSNDGAPSPRVTREPVQRRTSHTMAEAFLEQLPEVQSRDSAEAV